MGAQVEAPPEVTKHDDELTQKDRETLIEKISRMTVVEKIKAALDRQHGNTLGPDSRLE